MKKLFKIAAIAACIAASTVAANAQVNLKNVLEKATTILSSSDVQDVITSVTGVDLSNYIVTDITGAWSYTSMKTKVVSDDETTGSTLASIAGSAAVNATNTKLDKVLAKAGIKEGVMEYTFSSDSTFTHKIKNTTVSGTYSLNSDKQLTLNYGTTIKLGSIVGTVDIEDNTLSILFPADKFFSLMSKLSSSVKALSSLSTVVSKYDGMKVGVKLTKEE